MNKTLKKILPFAVLGLLVVVSAHAGNTNPFKESMQDGADTSDFESTATVIDSVLKFISYILWAASSVLIGMAGFKLKSGDVAGFAKTLLGGAAVFCSPFLIDFLYNLSQK